MNTQLSINVILGQAPNMVWTFLSMLLCLPLPFLEPSNRVFYRLCCIRWPWHLVLICESTFLVSASLGSSERSHFLGDLLSCLQARPRFSHRHLGARLSSGYRWVYTLFVNNPIFKSCAGFWIKKFSCINRGRPFCIRFLLHTQSSNFENTF